MDEATFWQLIATARDEAKGDPEGQADALIAILGTYPPEAIYAFDQWFQRFMDESYDWNLWAAAYIINGGCSDDGFDYFRGWLILQGNEVFKNALRDPDSLAVVIPADANDRIECESALAIATSAYEARTGTTMPAHEPTGTPWDEDDEEELRRRLPTLWARRGS